MKVRGSNDLVFIGLAPNLAAKLSEIRKSPYNSYVTANVYKQANESVKVAKSGERMWIPVTRTIAGEKRQLYKSRWWWRP